MSHFHQSLYKMFEMSKQNNVEFKLTETHFCFGDDFKWDHSSYYLEDSFVHALVAASEFFTKKRLKEQIK